MISNYMVMHCFIGPFQSRRGYTESRTIHMATWIKCSWSFRREVSFTNAIVEFGSNQFIRDRQHMNELIARWKRTKDPTK